MYSMGKKPSHRGDDTHDSASTDVDNSADTAAELERAELVDDDTAPPLEQPTESEDGKESKALRRTPRSSGARQDSDFNAKYRQPYNYFVRQPQSQDLELEVPTKPEDGTDSDWLTLLESSSRGLDRDELVDYDTMPLLKEASTESEEGNELDEVLTQPEDIRNFNAGPTQSEDGREFDVKKIADSLISGFSERGLDVDEHVDDDTMPPLEEASFESKDGKELDEVLTQTEDAKEDELVDDDTSMPPLEEASSESEDGKELDEVLTQTEDVKEVDAVPTQSEDVKELDAVPTQSEVVDPEHEESEDVPREPEDGEELELQRGIHNEVGFHCGFCGNWFISEMSLVRHKDGNSHHFCSKCTDGPAGHRRFRTHHALVQHLKDSPTHHFCSRCREEFPSSAALEVHRQSYRHHGSFYIARPSYLVSSEDFRISMLAVLLVVVLSIPVGYLLGRPKD